MTRDTVTTGKLAEDFAVRCLMSGGIEVLDRNYRIRTGEIDIISRENRMLVFTEVKYRKNRKHGNPCEAVDREKQRRISRTALHYLTASGCTDCPVRFDVIEVTGPPECLKARRIRGAFEYCG
ncbi:MAG: YraN family protein [Eubacteriaceae bacterium]|jgi:putative endonuclease